MKLTSVLLIVIGAVLLQVTLARYTVGGRWAFDFVLVGVAFAGLQRGPVAGIVAGTIGGLLQDVLAGAIVGVGGLGKTIAGFVAGLIGTHFVLVRPSARMLIVAVVTVAHRIIILGLNAIIDQRWSGVPWGAMLAEVVLNSLAALLLFQVTAALPGAVARQRARSRSTFGRRNW